MVEDFDLDELARPDEIAGHLDVRFGRGRIARWMAVHQDDRRGIGDDGRAEDFPGMDEDRVEGAGGHEMVAGDALPGVEDEDVEAFDVPVEAGFGGNDLPPLGVGLVRGVAHGQVIRQGEFPQAHDLILLGAERFRCFGFGWGRQEGGGLHSSRKGEQGLFRVFDFDGDGEGVAVVNGVGDAVDGVHVGAEGAEVGFQADELVAVHADRSVVVQASHDGRYHTFALAGPGGAGAATVLFDGQPIGSTLPLAASSALPAGLHWGTASTGGMVKASWQRVNFTLGDFSISGARLTASNTFQVLFPSRTNRTYGLYRTTNCLDWSPVSTNVPGTGLPVWAADPNPLTAGAMLYRVRMNP